MLVIFTVILLGLLVLGLPVAFSLGTAGLFGMFAFMGGGSSLAQIPILAYKSLDDFVLTAVPLYILMSQILLTGKVGNDLFELGNKWLRHLPGGLGVATVFACAIFAAITGSSVACAVTIGAIAIPEMLSRGYERTLVLGAVAAGGTLGILIPPSIPMILYGAITGESVGQLFMSGVVPGVILTLLFIAVVVYSSRKLPLQDAHIRPGAAAPQRAARITGRDGGNVVGCDQLHAVSVVVPQDLQRVHALPRAVHRAPLLHAGAGHGLAVAVFGKVRFGVAAALDRLAGGRLFLYGGGRPGAAQSAQKNASCSL